MWSSTGKTCERCTRKAIHQSVTIENKTYHFQSTCYCPWYELKRVFYVLLIFSFRDRRGRERMVVGFKTTYAIDAYHRWRELESRPGRGVQYYVIKFVSDLRQVGGFLWFPPPMSVKSPLRLVLYCYFNMPTINKTYLILSDLILPIKLTSMK